MKPSATLQGFFHYTRSERNGALVLVMICLIILFVPAVHSHLSEQYKANFTEFKAAIAAFEARDSSLETSGEVAIALFTFDPNQASKTDLVRLGLSERTAQTILNYRSKGGRFRTVSDFKRIYTISDKDYQRLAPFIHIPAPPSTISNISIPSPTSTVKLFEFDPNYVSFEALKELGLRERTAKTVLNFRSKGGKFRKKEDFKKIYGLRSSEYERLVPFIKIDSLLLDNPVVVASTDATRVTIPEPYTTSKPVIVDINEASKEVWEELKGIGPSYARRIHRFRTELGGFSSIEQVGETWKLPDSVFQKIRPQLRLVSPTFRQLLINTATVEELKAHPYLSWKQAKIIVKYRAQHGSFSNIEDVQKVKILEGDLVKRLAPYLAFE